MGSKEVYYFWVLMLKSMFSDPRYTLPNHRNTENWPFLEWLTLNLKPQGFSLRIANQVVYCNLIPSNLSPREKQVEKSLRGMSFEHQRCNTNYLSLCKLKWNATENALKNLGDFFCSGHNEKWHCVQQFSLLNSENDKWATRDQNLSIGKIWREAHTHFSFPYHLGLILT